MNIIGYEWSQNYLIPPEYIVMASIAKVLAKGSNEEPLDKRANADMSKLRSGAIKKIQMGKF